MKAYTPYLEWLDHQQGAMLELVVQWAGINSYSRNVPGLDRMLGVVSDAFGSLNGDREIVSLPSMDVVDGEGMILREPVGRALHIRKRSDSAKQVLLNIHYDTVYSTEHPFQRCESPEPNVMRGPGVADAKGGLVVMLKALEAFERSPFSAGLDWEVLITPDEEIGSPGSAFLLIEAAKRNDLGLVFEPSSPDGTLAGSRRGSGNFYAVFRGKAAHAGRDPKSGRNAIDAMAEFIVKLNSAFAGEEGVTVNVGKVQGGGPLNIVPDMALCGFNLRVRTAQDLERVETAISDLSSHINKREGISLQIHGRMARPPKPLDERTRILFDCLQRCGAQLGLPIKWAPSGGASDGNTLAAAGLPTIDSLGVRGGNLHSSEEYLLVDSLTERAKLTALMLMKLAEGECREIWAPSRPDLEQVSHS